MADWLKYQSTKWFRHLSEFGSSPAFIADHIYQVGEEEFVWAQDQLNVDFKTKGLFVSRLYWAHNVDAIRCMILGKVVDVAEYGEIPLELLLHPEAKTYQSVVGHILAKNLEYRTELIRALQGGSVAYVGLRVSVGRLDYYFKAYPEEWVEMKQWSSEPIYMVGLRLEDDRWDKLGRQPSPAV